ncbi:MAG: membrane protein [Candidatus Hydrogenedentota bacterium]
MGGSLLRALFALVLIYVLIDLLTHREVDIARYDVPASVVFQYYLNFIPQIVLRVAPFAVLISALLVLGDAAQNNEVTAVLAGGISLRRLVRVPVGIALALSGAVFLINETVGTTAAQRAQQIEEGYFSRSQETERRGTSWANLSGGWTCHIGKFNRIALTGEDVLIYLRTPEEIQQVEARRIYWDEGPGRWILEDGGWYTFDPGATRLMSSRIRQRPAPFSETPDQLFALEKPAETKSAEELMRDIESAGKRSAPVTRLLVDYHAKFSQPVVSFVMIWLAVPFAMRLRRGGLAIGFGASLAIAIAYLLVYAIAMSLGYAERIEPPVAAWCANAVFLAVGLFLFWRTPT